MAADTLIFDLDGTVWDSAAWFASGLADDEADAPEQRARLVAGGNIIGALRAANVSTNRLVSRAAQRLGPPVLFPGMDEALKTLVGDGRKLAVATSLPGRLAQPMLELAGLSTTFSVVIHAGVCRTAKPHPRSLLMAAERLGTLVSPRVIYVGDRQTDAHAAAAAGMGFAWVVHGYERPADGSRLYSAEELVAL